MIELNRSGIWRFLGNNHKRNSDQTTQFPPDKRSHALITRSEKNPTDPITLLCPPQRIEEREAGCSRHRVYLFPFLNWLRACRGTAHPMDPTRNEKNRTRIRDYPPDECFNLRSPEMPRNIPRSPCPGNISSGHNVGCRIVNQRHESPEKEREREKN